MNNMFKKIAIGLGVLIFVLSVAAVIGIYWLGQDSEKELQAARQRLIDMGAPMTIEELLPPPVPEGQNAAPLYLELIAMEEKNPAIDEAMEDIEALTEDYDLDEVYSMSLTDEQFVELEEILNREELKAYFALLEQITELPYFQPDWDYSEGPALLIPEVGTQRTAAQLLLAKAALSLHLDDTSLATEFTQQALFLAEHVNQSYTFVSILTANAIRNSVHVLIESIDRQSDEGIPESLALFFGGSPLADNWINAIDLERLVMGETIFPAIIEGDIEKKRIIFGEDETKWADLSDASSIRWFFIYDYALYLNIMADSREFAELPFHESIDDERVALEQSMLEAREHYRIITSIIVPTFAPVRTNLVQSDSKQLLALTGLSLSAYYRDHAKYPETLEALVPDYLDELPIDPLSGESFLYRKEGEGYSLYGLGPNRVDDGGETNEEGGADDEYGDLIWRGKGSVFSSK